MALYLARHGETDWNKEGRFQSRTDVPLNDTGRQQARAIRDELRRRGVEFTAAYCSPMGRAQETAAIILEDTGLSAQVEPAFIEIDFGGFEGQLASDLMAKHGTKWQEWRQSEYTQTAPEGGENILTGAERVREALEQIRPQAASSNVLVVAHQALNMALKVAISGRTDVASAATFRQGNDEVDIWDVAANRLQDQFRVSV